MPAYAHEEARPGEREPGPGVGERLTRVIELSSLANGQATASDDQDLLDVDDILGADDAALEVGLGVGGLLGDGGADGRGREAALLDQLGGPRLRQQLGVGGGGGGGADGGQGTARHGGGQAACLAEQSRCSAGQLGRESHDWGGSWREASSRRTNAGLRAPRVRSVAGRRRGTRGGGQLWVDWNQRLARAAGREGKTAS